MDDPRSVPLSAARPAPGIHPRTTDFIFLGVMCGVTVGLLDGMLNRFVLGDLGLAIFWLLDSWFNFVDKSNFAYSYIWHWPAFAISGLLGAVLGGLVGALLGFRPRSKGQHPIVDASSLACASGPAPARTTPGFITCPNLFSILLVVLLAASYFGMMGDLDWAWQVRTGELIIETGSLRTPESFSYTINGAQVHDFEWLYEVTIYYVWSVFGIGGLKFLKMAAIATPLILLGWRLKREGVRWHGIALSLMLAVWILSGAWNLRALAGFRVRIKSEHAALKASRTQCEAQIAEQRARLLKARKDCRVLEQLKEKRQKEWSYLGAREVEDTAAESYLANWSRSNAEQ